MTPAGVLLREVIGSVSAQRVATLVTLLLMLAATATVVVTAGRNAGAEQAVLAKLDAAGTRSLTVRAKGPQPGFTAEAVPRLAGMDVVEQVVGFGPVVDVTAAAIPQGIRVGMLPAYGTLGDRALADLPAKSRRMGTHQRRAPPTNVMPDAAPGVHARDRRR